MTEKIHTVRKLLMSKVLYLIMILMVIVIACISPDFLSFRVLRDILMQSSTKLIVAAGCLFIIISGGADLSGGRMVGFAAVISGSLAQQSTYYLKFWPNLPELPVFVPFIVSVLVGLLVGCFNGWVVSKLKVPAFLATLGSQMIIYGVNCLYFNKAPNNSQPLGGYKESFMNIGTGTVLGIPYLIIISTAVLLAVHVLLTKTNLGKEIFAVGGNFEAAKVSGINVYKIQLFTYGMAGALYGLAGCIESVRTGSATSAYGNGYELDTIASCIVGGCSLSGGVGTVPGVFVGVIIFNVINYGLTFVGLSSYWQYVVKGLIIIGAIALDVRKNMAGD